MGGWPIARPGVVSCREIVTRATRVTSDEFQSHFGSLSDKAKREPVIITQRGEDALVVVSAEEWARLSRRDRRVGATEDLPDEWFDALLKAEVPPEFAHLNAELERPRVALPEPIPGLVLRYSYLWLREMSDSREEGSEDRPCALVVALRAGENGRTRAIVLPITHVAPQDPESAVELPLRVKRRLGLDEAPSWIVLSEWNDFVWPGPDLRPVPGRDDGSVAYGVLPPALFAVIRDRFAARVRRSAARPVARG